jgi:hypothetical protein
MRWVRWPVLSWRRTSNVDDAVQGYMTGMLVCAWTMARSRAARWTPARRAAGVC